MTFRLLILLKDHPSSSQLNELISFSYEGVSVIGPWTFNNCTGLKDVTIPNSVTAIDGNAFADCAGLTDITIPDGVTYIGS